MKIISGDDPKTVCAIARKAHLKGYENFIEYEQYFLMMKIPRIVNRYTIFGRVSPIQKKLLIKALKNHKHVTAMIGDGVNDVMALKEADCSISVAQRQ